MSRYRSPSAYRFPKTYRGAELVPAVPPPGFGTPASARWVLPEPRGRTLHAPWMQAGAQQHTVAAPFDRAAALADVTSLRFSRPEPRADSVRAPWAEASQQLASFARVPWSTPAAQGQGIDAPWGRAVPQSDTLHAPWRTPIAVDQVLAAAWGTATPRERLLSAFWRAAAARGAVIALPWGPAGQRQTHIDTGWPIEPPPGPGNPITVPIREAYIMIPNVSAVVLPGREPLELLSVRLSTDVDSYGWAMSGQIPYQQIPMVTPVGRADPVEIEVTVNGYTWVLLVEGQQDNRRFGGRTATIRGRSRSALLDAPFAPGNTGVAEDARTANQLADEQLFGTGWTLVWDAVDWLLPGSRFSYNDATVMQAIGELAAAIGARIETARTALELRVAPRYPVSPWAWDSETPYAIIPASVVPTLSSDYTGGPNANGVYVLDGTGAGALVRITGTGGEVQVGQVVERLLSTSDAQRERGRAELARAGKTSAHSVQIPLFPSPADPGLIPIGALLQITEPVDPADPEADVISWKGQCMAVTIDADKAGSATSVRQTLTVERHYRD